MTTHRRTYDSVSELAAKAESNLDLPHAHYSTHRQFADSHDAVAGASFDEAARWARTGWPEGEATSLPVVQTALEHVAQDTQRDTFTAEYDVSGSSVDVGRYLSDVPECMVNYEPATISTVGRVVVICASASFSGSVTVESAIKRGSAVTALALSLEKMGHATEIWQDMTSTVERGRKKDRYEIRVKVKGAHDVTDPSMLAFALAHPAFLRQLMFVEMADCPLSSKLQHNGYGVPTDPAHDLPEGTIYLPALRTARDVPDADRYVLDTLRSIGLLEDSP